MARASTAPLPDPQTPASLLKPFHSGRERHIDPDLLAPRIAQWPARAGTAAPLAAPSALLSFSPQAVSTSFRAARLSDSGFIPPDSMGAIGPTQVLVIVNGRIRVFSTAGILGLLNADTDSFFGSVRGGFTTSDPHVRYDRLSGRWFITMVNVPVIHGRASGPNRIVIAVSSGPTITNASSFTFFQFQQDQVGTIPNADTNAFADYDTLGVDAKALYIGADIFDQSLSAFLGTTGFVVNKADLLNGILTVTPFRSLTATGGPRTPQGVNNDDPLATEGYFIGPAATQFSRLVMRRISNPGGVPSISSSLNIVVPATTFPILQRHFGAASNRRLDALDDRLFGAQINKNQLTGISTLWTAHNIEVNAGGVAQVGGGRNGSRWYEISNLTLTPTLNQAGTLFDSNSLGPRGFWIPSVAMSGQGHMALGCSTASATRFVEIAVSGRLSSDSLGATQAFTTAQVSTTGYNVEAVDGQRWGDYSQVSVDPNDDMTMWTFQEYCDATNSWGVRAIRLLAPPPAAPTSASPSTLPKGLGSVNVTITGSSVSGAGFFDPGSDPGGPGFANHIVASVTGGVVVNSVTFTNPTHVTLSLSTLNAAFGSQSVTIINPDGQSRTGAGILTISGVVSGPTSTPTGTRTQTATATPTNTSTDTPTATETPTTTATRTVTNTPVNTPTPTRTATATASGTRTSTGTPSNTPLDTPTPSQTATVTETATSTATGTPSSTPLDTSTPTKTATATETATRTTTRTPSNTPLSTPTPTETPTRTATTTATQTGTATVTLSATASSTATRTPTMTLTRTPSNTPSTTPTVTQTPLASRTPTRTPTLTPFRKV